MSKSKGNAIVPDRDPRQVRRRRRPLARSDGPAGPGLPLRRDPDEGRSPAGDEGPERLQVRARQRRGDRLEPPRSPSRSTGRCSASWPRRCARPRRAFDGLRLHHCAGGHRAVLLGLLRRLRRAGQGAGVRRRGRRGNRLRQGGAGDRAARAAAAVRALPALRHRGGLVVVAGRARSTGRRGRPRPTSAMRRAATRRCSTPSPRCSPACAGRSRRPRSACAPSSPRSTSPAPRPRCAWPSRPPGDLRAAGKITGELAFAPTEDTEIAGGRGRAAAGLSGRRVAVGPAGQRPWRSVGVPGLWLPGLAAFAGLLALAGLLATAGCAPGDRRHWPAGLLAVAGPAPWPWPAGLRGLARRGRLAVGDHGRGGQRRGRLRAAPGTSALRRLGRGLAPWPACSLVAASAPCPAWPLPTRA